MTPEKRLVELSDLLERLLGDSYADQYHIADWAEEEPHKTNMKKLSDESEFYGKVKRDLINLKLTIL